jgi:hypothetical protein
MASAPIVVNGFSQPDSVPIRRLWYAEVLWLAFVIVQALDGAMSYIGVSVHGLGIEANPLVAWYLGVLGPAAGFAVAKLFAVTCGAVLYVAARYVWVALLTVVYLVFAVGPWVEVLSGSL